MMRERSTDGKDLRRILIGMVTDKTTLARISGQWRRGGLFEAPWANLIGGWCVDHLNRYGGPPNGQIQPLYEDWASKVKPDDKIQRAVERFLVGLSDEFEQSKGAELASDYVLDVAAKHFQKVRLRQAVSIAEDEMDRNEIEQARQRLNSVERIELGPGAMVKPPIDFAVWRQAFDRERRQPLLSYPGSLGRFLNDSMVRDHLIGFMAIDKIGKSMWLLDLAFRAIRRRRRVAFFDVGDMTQDDVLLRLGQRASRRPKEPGVIFWPTAIDEDGEVTHQLRKFGERLTPREAWEAFRRVTKGRDVFRLSCHANSSINVSGIDSTLTEWGREDWMPDVVVIDYADILAPPSGVRETLDQIDETWKQLRRLSQEHHCLVATATQASATAYNPNQRCLGRRHFSGRKTKLAHVNGMIGLNVSEEDDERGVTRVNWIVRREGSFNENKTIAVAGCLAVACPAVKS